MAIKVLTKLLAENAPKAMKERKFESYFGRKIAIDASTSIYQFLIVVGRSGTEMLTNEAGEVTSHLQGMFTRTIRLLEAGIKPVYVFYGKPPDPKKQELAKRYSKKADPSDGLAEAEETGNKVTKHHNEDCKRLLKLIEVPVIEAPSDGEAQCAALCKPGKVYAVASENMDSLTFGARFLLHLMDPSSRKVPVVEFEVAKTLEELNLTMDQFIDLCIFSECDYCDSIRGIVGQTALKLIRLHGSIENMLENISKERYHIPDDWPYQEARQLFKESVVYTNEVQHEIKRGAPDEEVINLLKLSHKSDHQTSSTHTATHLNNLLNTTLHTKNLKHATQIHAQIITNNYTCLPFLFNNLLNYYAKCGNINRSLLLFSTNHDRCKNIVGWTSLITHLSHCNKPLKALTFFNKMRCTGVYPNQFTFSAILPACADTMIVTHGEQVHCLIWKHGFKTDVFVGSALVGMYAKYADMSSAESVFYELPERSLVSWNSILVGFLQNKSYYRAVEVFREVLRQSLDSPDEVSCSAVLSGCANIGCVEFGRQAHGIAVKLGLVTLTYVKNSLMDMYCKCGLFGDAVKLFKTMGDTDVVAWNIMIMGCVHSNNFEEACNYFWVMRREGISPDEASYSSVLHASASLAALNQGTLIHDHTIKTGFVKNACVASSLITMYAKSGSLVDAYRVFEEIEDRNVVCWTAIIAACQQHGCANQVVELFEEMLGKGIKPDYITFVSVLSACSHAGHVEEGFVYFYSMTEVHAMNPGPEHYACMVDLLGRVGRLDEAKRFIESMPIKPDPSVWGALFGACRNYGNLEMGREIAERLFELEPDNPGNYVMLSNMFTCNGMLEEADEVRRLMRVNGVRKEPGCSWIDVKNTTFVFTVHDRSHSRTDEIYEILRKLEKLVKKKGYEPETQFAINSVEGYKEQSLWYHSEKLALAFGLLTLPVGTPIRIKKNLRTCGDCHTVMKFASEIFEREIIVRDINRFHRFTNGLCSCRDYW